MSVMLEWSQSYRYYYVYIILIHLILVLSAKDNVTIAYTNKLDSGKYE